MTTPARRGFTLIELLIVVVIIGILASIAIPKFSSTRERAYIAAVTADLKSLASMQETYQSDNMIYATNVSQITDLTVTQGVNLTINMTDQGIGWAATGYHDAIPGRLCGIFYGTGTAAQATPATQAGVIACQG